MKLIKLLFEGVRFLVRITHHYESDAIIPPSHELFFPSGEKKMSNTTKHKSKIEGTHCSRDLS